MDFVLWSLLNAQFLFVCDCAQMALSIGKKITGSGSKIMRKFRRPTATNYVIIL